MANVRFLDQIPVTSFASTGGGGTVGNKRFNLAGEVLIIPAGQQLVCYDFYNLGLVIVEEGEAVTVGNETVYTHGLWQVQTVLNNEGTITNNGIIVNSETLY